MQNWIISLSSVLPERLVGRKAAALGRLMDAGFPVPSSVCITTEAFRAATNRMGDLSMPDGLLEALIRILPIDAPLAVRSSAVMEDLPETSQAGRYITRLNVLGAAALEQAVLDCWGSFRNASAGLDAGDMAILIQHMLEAECAGVCFTVDPVRQRPDLLMVSAAWGLGIGVVSGSVPTDTTRLHRIGLETEDVRIADKHTAMRPAMSGGVTELPVPENLRAIPCLPENWLQRIGQFGLAIEQRLGAPQDIEWTIAGGQLWILQSRPITTLPKETQEAVRFPISWSSTEEPRLFWWLEGGNGGEMRLPAQLDFMRFGVQGGQDAVYNGGKEYTRWRKEVNGRTYMAADKSPNSPSHVRVYRAANRDLYERLEKQGITWWEHWGPEIVLATRRLASFNGREADGPALADHIEDAAATAKRHWMIHTIVPGRPIRSAALLDSYARMVDQSPGELAEEIPFLIAGAETIQTRLVEDLYELACLALESTETAQEIALGNPLDLEPDMPSMQGFAAAFQRLIAGYGDRLCYRKVPGFPVELALPWREAQGHIWEMIASYLPLARQGGPGPRRTRLEAQGIVNARVDALRTQAISAGKDPALVEDFLRKLTYARRNAAFLDEHDHYIDQLSEGQYVQALLYAGRWLAALGTLPDPFDVFWLYMDEVLAALREPLHPLTGLLDKRRDQFGEWLSLIPPACLGLPDPRLPDRILPSSPPASSPAPTEMPANTLVGEPASRGRAAGRARIVVGNSLPAELASSDVIVAPYAGSQLIPFLPAVAAVVLDYGGPGDHFAITAREFGLPAVCAARHATQRIHEGAWVTVDADTGLVSWTD
jgi:rifampicin phosphotransferase